MVSQLVVASQASSPAVPQWRHAQPPTVRASWRDQGLLRMVSDWSPGCAGAGDGARPEACMEAQTAAGHLLHMGP